ncbi:MAG: ferritin [Proteobacteria bacterium]|nr:MAG: ferritin [Pseudomonadota bacterium]
MARSTPESAQRVRVMGDLTNRTGIESSPLADAMREGARAFTPNGGEADFKAFRGSLLREPQPVGTIPRPPSLGGAAKQAMGALTGQKPLVLLDKLGERLAFERTGTRLYETLIAKHEQEGSFDGGPSAAELRQIRDEELEHFHTLVRFVEQLGGDPTAVTPSADLAAVASMGVVQVVADPRVSFGESLDAILIAELVDHDCWKNLRALAEQAGNEQLHQFTQRAEDEEDRHLANVRRWVQARTLHGE